jgi:plasmid stabilization system protein ParE
MTLAIVFSRAAQADYRDAVAWYEKQRSGLGDRFRDRVQEALDRIATTPEMHQFIYKDVRRTPIQGFPYSVMYRVQSKKIRVLAVFHGRRDPSVWQGRA